ncbi:MAG: bifunctional phosphoribosylaminoimidazolecarboxamide formyltransferase/IMP cyclohydrolase [Candidatus Solincola sediminis]|uniref:Bifunctional purine biosynthesis protein PurH n=1 Tax=Candidatus Solincola sediminis TaxID=1797199 RepID=A0A1F2WK62_9ACTN|nr:MAG: bifunctional phosphoribosylaminoimidazolecarboxamide formyltransferase/IMP cyclohydrolase [Candidatus Solincola sediminis]OFW57248.1 MAG: bifunctional phosphoribosylaminoimidazolecarboxamide formyltransferase/IMP cyclohydrolase [Candidatus Solincola sediminis]
MAAIKRALLSVSSKVGIVGLARELQEMGVEIISTGGTEKRLKEEGVEVTPISEVTGFPEMLGGRVKTLHPHIHGGLLADRGNPGHMQEMEEMGIKPIDLVVVNLYPFEETVAKPETSLEEAVEQIDIGGVTLIRAAAKNFAGVAIVTNPKRYSSLLLEMRREGGGLSEGTRRTLAEEAFRHTSAYDTAIYAYLSKSPEEFPDTLNMVFKKKSDLRYGENPHQQGALYQEIGAKSSSLVFAEQLHGKELSFNNMLDLDAAWALSKEFGSPAVVMMKHNNPCGVAEAEDLAGAYRSAFECDPVSAFGSVMAFNRPIDEETAGLINSIFVEVVIAPGFSDSALDILTGKEDIRLLRLPVETESSSKLMDLKRVEGGLLVQDYDRGDEPWSKMSFIAEREPDEEQRQDLIFAWKVAQYVKSNAIVLVKGRATVGIGAGQMSRVDSAYIAVRKAGEKSKGSVCASDAFFPFADAVIVTADAGVEAYIQPGGSVRDEEIFEEIKKRNLVMVLTGKRHFRH